MRFIQPIHDQSEQSRPIDRHEETLNIQTQDPAIVAVIIACGSQKSLCPANSEQRAFANPATIAVVNKLTVKTWRNPIVQEMVYYPVPEICSDNFTLYGRFIDKAEAWTKNISSVLQFRF